MGSSSHHPTGIPLAHLLPPSSHAHPDLTCPTVICGQIPASSPLHLAIGRNITQDGYDRLKGLNDAQGVHIPVRKLGNDEGGSTWIITSGRAGLHSSLVQEDERFLREHGGHPIVREALDRTEIKYCSTFNDCLLLVHLLHPNPPPDFPWAPAIPTPALPETMTRRPSLIIIHDVLGLCLAGPTDLDAEPKQVPPRPEFKEGFSMERYMNLIALIRGIPQQLPDPAPALLILEPRLNSPDLDAPFQTTRARSGSGGPDRYEFVRALRWVFGDDQVWSIDRDQTDDHDEETGTAGRRIRRVGDGVEMARFGGKFDLEKGTIYGWSCSDSRRRLSVG